MDLEGFNDLRGSGSINIQESIGFNAILRDLDSEWFVKATRSSRWMDLIGDFAGNEPFIIDGEALIRAVVEDPLLSIGKNDCSFQIIHAYHILEKFLNNFKQRSNTFDIIFWHNQRHFAIQEGLSTFEVASRVLARSMLFQHIVTNLDFDVHVFDNLEDPAWIQYVAVKKPMYVMTNGGGLWDENLNNVHSAIVLLQRCLLLGFLSKSSGIAVALLNGAEYRDSKILTFVYEPGSYGVVPESLRKVSQAIEQTLQSELTSKLLDTQYRLQVSSDMIEGSHSLLRNIFQRPVLNIVTMIRQGVPAELIYLFLVHILLVPTLSVYERAQEAHPDLCTALIDIIRDTFFPAVFLNTSNLLAQKRYAFDIDGTIFALLVANTCSDPRGLPSNIGPTLHCAAQELWSTLDGPPLDFQTFATKFPLPPARKSASGKPIEAPKLLEFSNPVFDEAFAGLKLPDVITESDASLRDQPSSRFGNGILISDDRHWHSGELIMDHWRQDRLLPSLRLSDPWRYMRKKRADQLFMSNMQKQAASLTGASGKTLRQIMITPVGKSKPSIRQEPSKSQKSYRGKNNSSLSSKEKIIKKIEEDKENQIKVAWTLKWKNYLSSISNSTLTEKIFAMENFCRNKAIVSPVILLETQMFRLHLELQIWVEDLEKDVPPKKDRYSVSIMRMVNDIAKIKITLSAKKTLTSVLEVLGFRGYADSIFQSADYIEDQSLNFPFIKLVHSKTQTPRYPFMHIAEHPIDWQLRLFGDYMDRSMDGSPDKRVSFEPDAWQKTVLDGIDQNKSLLVVAPTSAGKTFISFYAMEKVLRESDTDILVYIAPTKALVNQIAAEVYARFSKDLNGRSCWSIHTRDYHIHDPQNCQILVTVPEMLAIMLLSPPLARAWTPRIKRIILDEIHCLGQEEVGSVWEQIILLAPCPIIGLSATIGSPDKFSQWLGSVQQEHGFEYKFIEHRHRYSHLRKFYYKIDGKGKFSNLDEHKPTDRSRFLHPIGLLSFRPRSLPEDLSLEAADTRTLFLAIRSVSHEINSNVDALSPQMFFPASRLLRQKDVLLYEAKLKSVLSQLMTNYDTRDLSNPLGRIIRELQDPIMFDQDTMVQDEVPSSDAFKNDLLVLLADLSSKDELPAILFNFDRRQCEVIAQHLLENLCEAEEEWRSKNPQWLRKIQAWEHWKAKDKTRNRALNNEQRITKDRNDDKHDSPEPSWLLSFDPDDPSPEFSFAGKRSSYSKANFEEDLKKLANYTPEWAFRALRRGIAVHHSGMYKRYRALVESLFRQGFIRVVIATGTLAHGINAPTKTAIFCGDSPFLTALMYRQCSGRAGRRGFDLRGNVIFYGLPLDRVQRLTLSRLPTLGGSFPLPSSMVLRLLGLLSGSENSDFAIKSIRSLLSLPRMLVSSNIGRDQILHHWRFTIEYLRRSHLVSSSGKPMNLSAIATHLFYHEPANFAFVALMRSGVLHNMCSTNSQGAKREFMIVMSHLFGRRYLSNFFATETKIKELKSKYPSMVILPPLPQEVRTVLEDHDREILSVFRGYAAVYVAQYVDHIGPDDTLPLSGLRFCGVMSEAVPPFQVFLRKRSNQLKVRSAFAGNSGHDDAFKNVSELAGSSRDGLHLNAHVIPSMLEFTVDRENTLLENRLNAHILDFYIHGQTNVLREANGIRQGDVWFILQDFSLTLKTMRTGLQQLLLAFSEAATVSIDGAPDSHNNADGISGSSEDDASEDDDEEVGQKENFARPKYVRQADWNLYTVLSEICDEFEEKFRGMWA